MSRVLVTDGELRASLAAVRSLGRTHRVAVASGAGNSLAGASRYAASDTRTCSPLVDPAGFRKALAGIVARESIDIVLPVSDAACRALLQEPDVVLPARIAAPGLTPYTLLSHKGETSRLARERGVEVPEGDQAKSFEEALALARSLGWPVIVKPVLSVAIGTGNGLRKRGVEQAHDEATLRAVWTRTVAPGSALVQRVVPGWGEGLFVLRWEGRTRAAFAHRRLREKPPSGGTSVLSESIPVDARLLARVESMLDACGFSGVAMAELRSDGRSHWLMEFNARLWGSLQLAIDAGIDFPALLVAATLGAPASDPPGYRVGVRSRWLLGEVDHALALARGARGTDGRSGVGAALSVLFRPGGPDCHVDNPRRGDVRPFLRELRSWAGALVRRRNGGLK